MQPVGKTLGVGKQWSASGSWGEEDDGGWSQGPPASGSGWMGGTAAANGSNRDMENWGQNSHDQFIDWQRQQPPNIIVDRNDKEAWPSIGGSNHSETASDHDDDNASGKSGSVISVSSNHGQSQGQEANTSGSSAIQGQSASSLWSGGNSSFNGVESNTWGVGLNATPSSSAAMGWGSSNPSLSMNNQGHNMQSITSMAGNGSDLTNSLNFSSRMSAGWGAPGSLPQGQNQNQGGNRPQNSVQIPQSSVSGSNVGGNIMQGAVPGSGAPQQQNGPQMSAAVSQLGPINNPSSVQQGNSAFQSVGFPRSTADSAWGSTSSGASPIGANNIGSDAANAGKGNSGNNGQVKSGDSNVSAGGWGVLPNASDASTKTSTSGWPTGNPSSTSSDWGNPPPSNSQWGSPVTPSQQGAPQWPGGPPTSASNSNQPRSQTTWAQAATKGLAPNNNASSNTASNQSATAGSVPSATTEKDREIMKAIESHEGWGQKPVRQDTAWDQIQTSPKTQRKFSSSSTDKANNNNNNTNTNNSNMWNNNNGTAIWESNKEPTSGAWNSATPNPRSGSQWEGGDNRDSWSGPPKQAEAAGNAWGGSAASGAGNNENSQSSEWGGKTETGSWPGAGDDSGISTWGEDGQSSGWDGSQGNSNRSGTDGTYVWGEPQKPPQNWNGPPNQNAAPMPRGVRPQSTTGWGDPGSPNTSSKVDDGTCHWGVNQQRPPSGFGEPGQWNPAVGPLKPKPSTSSSSSWGEEWNPSADPRKGGFNKFPGGNQPQMRSRMLQQLMEMGFQKDEAQHALISNNMNFQNALADLYKQKGANPCIVKRDYDMDVFLDGAKPKLPGMDIGATDNLDISADTQLDSNPYVPNNSMQNTPFQNAQIPNQFNYKGPSLPPSSQQNNVSIMPQQQRIIQEKFKQQQQPNSSIPPPPLQSTQGIVGRGQILPTTATAVQQQMAQQQILQQLHLAVKAGLISPQLLNQQLPPPMLVMLQQLLQHQQCLQQLITTQQLIQQNKMGQNPVLQRQQLEQVAMKINAIKQQILTFQRQISDAQRVLIKQQSSNLQPPQEMDPISSLPTDMANLNITNQTSQPQTQQQPQPLQSKLSQWKRPSEKETNNNNVTTQENSSLELNKAVGSKPGIPQSRSTPNLEFGLGLTNLGGDSTWSNSPTTTSASQNWPSSIGTSSSSESTKDSSTSDGKESQDSPVTTSSTSVLLNDSIPEFVPGKPWQGISTKSVEDDPHITPGSFSLTRSFSVSTVKENDLISLTKPIPSASESPSWSTNPKNVSQKWSGDNSIPAGSSFSNEVWGVPIPKNTSRPPPGLIPNKTIGSNSGGWSGGINRQHSWAGPKTDNSAFSAAGNSGWDSRMPNNVSTCLILRNLTPQIDGSTLRTLCLQHGPLVWFYLSLNHGQALVRYNSREEAMKAQKSLNTCVLGNTTIVAEFVSDAEANRFVEQSAIPAQPSQWSQQQNSLSFRQSNRNDGSWSSTQTQVPVAPGYPGNMWTSNSGGGLWGGSGVDEHNALLGNMLGESM